MKVLHRYRKLVGLFTTVLFCCANAPALYAHDEASLPGSNFEIDIDANLVVDHELPSTDWKSVSQFVVVRDDEPSGSNDDAFGQGSKEDSPVPSPVTGSIPPNKSDLEKFGLYFEDNGLNQRFLHLFWTRVQDPSGTTNMDFEFNQSNISANGVTPVRTNLDLLIQYDLENGGTRPVLFLSLWLDGSDGATAAECEASSKLPCWSQKIDLEGIATGSINSTFISDANSGLGDLDPRTFGEASIDFGQIADALDSQACLSFGSAHLKSRSSDSFTSSLKDFIAPITKQVSNCATIKITKQDDATPTANLLPGVEFKLYADNAPFGGTYNDSGEDGTTALDMCTTNASGTCTMSNVFPGHYWVIETIGKPGHDLAPPSAVEISGPGANANLTITNPRQPAEVTINKKDDSGATLNGATFTLYSDVNGDGTLDGGDSAFGACTTSGSGSCKISNILPPGKYCIDETVVPAGYTKDTSFPQCFTLGLNETKTLNSINPRQPASVTIVKKDDAGASLQGAGFTLYSDDDEDGVLDPEDTSFNSCTTNAGGTCTISNILPPGEYCLDETTVPIGYTKDAAFPQCFTLALNDSKSVNSTNPRKPAKVVINKTDDASPANVLQGAGFTLYTDAGTVGTLDGADATFGSCTTNASGTCSIENILPAGPYCLDETTVPSGYSKDTNFPQCFALALDQTKTVSSVNPRKRGAIKITKTRKHAAASKPLVDPHAGVDFEIKDSSGTVVGSGKTDTNGEYCVDNLLFSSFTPGDGMYVVTETVPKGYQVDQANPQKVTIDQEGSCGNNEETLSFGNTPLTDFTITVNSQVDGGTSTVISCDKGNGEKSISAKSPVNGDGSHDVTGLLPGTYSCTLVISP